MFYITSGHKNLNFNNEQDEFGPLLFYMLKFFIIMVNLSLVLTGNQHLVQFLLIIKAQFQCTQNEDFYTYYFKGVLMYAVISRHFIRKFIIWRLMSEKTVILRILWIYVLSHFLLLFIQLRFFFRMYLKGMFLLSCRSLEVLRFKIERDVFVKLPFLGSTSFQIRKKLQKLSLDHLFE